MGYLYFDTETTGLKPGQICELSYIIENEGKIDKAKNYFFEVDEMSEGAENTHHLSMDKLKGLSGGLRFKDVADELYKDFSTNILVGHNVDFDIKFISMEFWRCGMQLSPIGKFDTMSYFNPILKLPMTNKYKNTGSKFKNPKLSELCSYFGIPDNKGIVLASALFGKDDKCEISFHDSRFDIAMTFISVLLHREDVSNLENKSWHNWIVA